MQIEEAKQHIEIFEMALRSKQCLGEQELEEYKLCQAIDTVLNELDIYKTNNEILHGELDRIGIDTLKLEEGMSTDDVIEEIKKKDKVIDEMATFIDDYTYRDNTDDFVCDFQLRNNCDCINIDCKECIKQYFSEKAQK